MDYIYILRSYSVNGSILKFGYSSDIWSRLSNYKASNPGIEIVYIAQLENAFWVEQEFHKNNKSIIGNEWYEESQLSDIMDYLNETNHVEIVHRENPNKGKGKMKFKYETKNDSFKDLAGEYCNLIDKNIKSDRLEYILNNIPDIKKIVETIGTSKVRTMKFSKKKIKDFCKDESPEIQNKIIVKLNSHFKYNTVYPSVEVKTFIQTMYNEYKIERKAKATDLAKYFKIDKKVRSINNKNIDSIILIN